jgi:hypothetical protein
LPLWLFRKYFSMYYLLWLIPSISNIFYSRFYEQTLANSSMGNQLP